MPWRDDMPFGTTEKKFQLTSFVWNFFLCSSCFSFFFSARRTTTLNDIHKNLGIQQKAEDKKHRRQDQFIDDSSDDYKEEYDEGDITGFMVEKPLTTGTNSFDVSFDFLNLCSLFACS